ncbi:hypothetical protein ON010_g6120 [Phytophthora cinnamomi]|nr:hypothetical protein ON010_g6120 [Phytophthora cinnamomi]
MPRQRPTPAARRRVVGAPGARLLVHLDLRLAARGRPQRLMIPFTEDTDIAYSGEISSESVLAGATSS